MHRTCPPDALCCFRGIPTEHSLMPRPKHVTYSCSTGIVHITVHLVLFIAPIASLQRRAREKNTQVKNFSTIDFKERTRLTRTKKDANKIIS